MHRIYELPLSSAFYPDIQFKGSSNNEAYFRISQVTERKVVGALLLTRCSDLHGVHSLF